MPANEVKHLPRTGILSYEEILRIVRIATGCGVKKIRVTGGEPLTRKGVIHFIEQLSRNPAVRDTTLTTNATLLSQYAKDLKKAGVQRVNISLDTLKQEKFQFITGRNLLPEVFKGIKESIDCGLSPIKINCVVVKGFNDEEILDFVRLSLEYPLNVRFIEFMPLGENDYWSPDKIITIPEVMEIIQRDYSLKPLVSPSNQNAVARLFKIQGGIGHIGFISPLSRHFCKTCNRIRLTPDGKLRNCLFSDNETDIKGPLRRGVKDQVLQEIIRDSIHHKPPGHKLHRDISYKCKRSMWRIGG